MITIIMNGKMNTRRGSTRDTVIGMGIKIRSMPEGKIQGRGTEGRHHTSLINILSNLYNTNLAPHPREAIHGSSGYPT